jgi:hypothetical protein
MDTSLYVIRNKATATAFRHDTLEEALAALNFEVGERDLWVLFELDRLGGTRRIAEGQGHIKRPGDLCDLEVDDDVGHEIGGNEPGYHWRRLVERGSH